MYLAVILSNIIYFNCICTIIYTNQVCSCGPTIEHLHTAKETIMKTTTFLSRISLCFLLLVFFLFLFVSTNAQNSFRERALADPDIAALGADATNIIDGADPVLFPTNFAAIANAAQGGGANLNQTFNVTLAPYNADKTGNTDATSAINAAYTAALAAGGGTVIIPSGTYKINGQIHPKSKTRTIATGAVLNRNNHTANSNDATKTGSNSLRSGLVVYEDASNFSWIGGKITNSNGLYRGRAFETINCTDFELGDVEINYMGIWSDGDPAPSVGMWISFCDHFYIHDFDALAMHFEEGFLANTPFRWTGCSYGVVYNMEGLAMDNTLDLSADNTGNDCTQHDILCIDVDGHQNQYAEASAVLVGTAGSEYNHPGDHYNLYFVDITHDGPGSQPQFEVINSSSKITAKVSNIHFVGCRTNCDAQSAFRVFIGLTGNNLGITDVYLRKCILINTLDGQPGFNSIDVRTSGEVKVYIDEYTDGHIQGDPDYQLDPLTNITIIPDTPQPSDIVFIENLASMKNIRPFDGSDDCSIVQCPLAWTGDIQKWEQIRTGDYFYLKNLGTDVYMRPENANAGSDIQATTIQNDYSLWEFIPTTGEYGYLKNKATGMFVRPLSLTDDISTATGDNYHLIQVPNTAAGSWTQWKFVDAQLKSITVPINSESNTSINMKYQPLLNQIKIEGLSDHSDASIYIYNTSGQLLQSKTINQFNNQTMLNGNSIGICIVKVTQGANRIVDKIYVK